MGMRLLFACLILLLFPLLQASADILSVFPLGGQQGTSFPVEVRGKNLDGTYAVWFDCEDLVAEVRKIETVHPQEELPDRATETQKGQAAPPKSHRVILEVKVAAAAPIGTHRFRLVSSRGVSNPWVFHVNEETVVTESEAPHHIPRQAQPFEFPAILNGRVGQTGEVDYYSFAVQQGQELRFEVNGNPVDFDPVISLYAPAESWFGPGRLRRLAFNDEPDSRHPHLATLTHRFDKSGQYFAAVSEFLGQCGPHCSYQLRIVPAEASSLLPAQKRFPHRWAHSKPPEWRERDFARELEPERLKALLARTVRIPSKGSAAISPSGAASPSTSEATPAPPRGPDDIIAETLVATSLQEQEPNHEPGQALEVPLPSILTGTIQEPRDSDYFRIKVNNGASLAFEVQTTEELPKDFNPRLGVFDEHNAELLTNVYKYIEGDGDDWIYSLEPKTIYTFTRDGEYYVQIRDLTARYGSPRFRYRVLIRPQIPHVGEVEIKEDHLNLVRGEAKKLNITVGQEEGFAGDVAVIVDNLPVGVRVLPAAEVEPDVGPPFEKINPERFVPKQQTVAVLLLADPDAPLTEMPRFATVKVQPIVNGKPGARICVGEIPVMIVASDGAHVTASEIK